MSINSTDLLRKTKQTTLLPSASPIFHDSENMVTTIDARNNIQGVTNMPVTSNLKKGVDTMSKKRNASTSIEELLKGVATQPQDIASLTTTTSTTNTIATQVKPRKRQRIVKERKGVRRITITPLLNAIQSSATPSASGSAGSTARFSNNTMSTPNGHASRAKTNISSANTIQSGKPIPHMAALAPLILPLPSLTFPALPAAIAKPHPSYPSPAAAASSSGSGSAGSIFGVLTQPIITLPETPNENVILVSEKNYKQQTNTISVTLSTGIPEHLRHQQPWKVSARFLAWHRTPTGHAQEHHLCLSIELFPRAWVTHNSQWDNRVWTTVKETDGSAIILPVPDLQANVVATQSQADASQKNIIVTIKLSLTFTSSYRYEELLGVSVIHLVKNDTTSNYRTEILEHSISFPPPVYNATEPQVLAKHVKTLQQSSEISSFCPQITAEYLTGLNCLLEEGEQAQVKSFTEFRNRIGSALQDHYQKQRLINALESHIVDKTNGNTILHSVIQKNNLHFAAFLLMIGVSPELKNTSGETAKLMLLRKEHPENPKASSDFYSCRAALALREAYKPNIDDDTLSKNYQIMQTCHLLAFGMTTIQPISYGIELNSELFRLIFERLILNTNMLDAVYRYNNIFMSNNHYPKIPLTERMLSVLLQHKNSWLEQDGNCSQLVTTIWQHLLLRTSPDSTHFKALWSILLEISTLNEISSRVGFSEQPAGQGIIDFIPYLRQIFQKVDAFHEKKKKAEASSAANFLQTHDPIPYSINNSENTLKLVLNELEKMDTELQSGAKDLKDIQKNIDNLFKLKEKIKHATEAINNKFSQIASKLCQAIIENKLNYPEINSAYLQIQRLANSFNLDFKVTFDFLWPLRQTYAFHYKDENNASLVKKSVHLTNSGYLQTIQWYLLINILLSSSVNLEDNNVRTFLERKENYLFLILIFTNALSEKLALQLPTAPVTISAPTSAIGSALTAKSLPAAASSATASAAQAPFISCSTTVLPAAAVSSASSSTATAPTTVIAPSFPANAATPVTNTTNLLLFKWKGETIARKIENILKTVVTAQASQTSTDALMPIQLSSTI